MLIKTLIQRINRYKYFYKVTSFITQNSKSLPKNMFICYLFLFLINTYSRITCGFADNRVFNQQTDEQKPHKLLNTFISP